MYDLLFYIKDRNQTTTHSMFLSKNPDYFTSKIEIKPQLTLRIADSERHYFTSKIEIKPQLRELFHVVDDNYFTSKIEIKPQRYMRHRFIYSCFS